MCRNGVCSSWQQQNMNPCRTFILTWDRTDRDFATAKNLPLQGFINYSGLLFLFSKGKTEVTIALLMQYAKIQCGTKIYDGTNLVAAAKPLFTPGLDKWSLRLAIGLQKQKWSQIKQSEATHGPTKLLIVAGSNKYWVQFVENKVPCKGKLSTAFRRCSPVKSLPLSSDNSLDEESKHREHGQTTVLDLLDLELSKGVWVVSQA